MGSIKHCKGSIENDQEITRTPHNAFKSHCNQDELMTTLSPIHKACGTLLPIWHFSCQLCLPYNSEGLVMVNSEHRLQTMQIVSKVATSKPIVVSTSLRYSNMYIYLILLILFMVQLLLNSTASFESKVVVGFMQSSKCNLALLIVCVQSLVMSLVCLVQLDMSLTQLVVCVHIVKLTRFFMGGILILNTIPQ